MATMEKQKSRQVKKKKTRKSSEFATVETELDSATSSNQEEFPALLDLSQNSKDITTTALNDTKGNKESLSPTSDAENCPLLPKNITDKPHIEDVQKSLLSSCDSSPIHCTTSVDHDDFPTDSLMQVDSPSHKNVPLEQTNLKIQRDFIPEPSIKPYEALLQEVQTMKIESKASDKSSKDTLASKADKVQTVSNKSALLNSPSQAIKPFTEFELSALYSNHELECCAEFVSNFVESHLRPTSKTIHPLHDLLVVYLRAINRLVINSMDLDAMKKEGKEKQIQLWILETTTISENGECQDGNPVTASHAYQISRLNRRLLSQLGRLLSGMRELVNVNHSLDAYLCEAARLQIEGLVQCVTLACPEFASLAQNSEPVLSLGPRSSSFTAAVAELKACIAILFSFQRRPMREERFVHDTQEWLSRLVAVLLRVGSWQDHMFILNHVLRCPSGVGKWAACFIQTPLPVCQNTSSGFEDVSPFFNPYVDHMIATLASIILPIRERTAFLEKFCASLGEFSGTCDAWIVIDSDGDDDEDVSESSMAFRENDLVAFLNQVAIGPMFRLLLCIKQQGDQEIWTGLATTPDHFLRLLAFGTVLVRLLRRGLEALAAPRYRQLSKRLGRLVRHTVQYATDVWQIIRDTFIFENDPCMALRLQMEYDAFLVRATNCIHSSRHLGAWQFLAILPYSLVSLNTLWQLWYTLHEEDLSEETIINLDKNTDWEAQVHNPSLRLQIEERLASMPDSESYYLLTTFANMALSRTNCDWAFIRAVSIDLLQIGFLSSSSQEACSKSVRILLGGLVAKHPLLLSAILARLEEKFSSAGKLFLYLFRELPLGHWQPTQEDVTILSRWLLRFSITSPENGLARFILTNLNWGFGMNDELFLVPQLHRDVAVLVLKAALHHVPDATGSTAVISESVKQVSSMVWAQTPDQAFTQWVWDMFARLRLHLLDQSQTTVWSAMSNLPEMLQHVPDLEDETLVDIALGVKQNHSAASFTVVAVTQIGHSIPLICNQGFQHLHLLLNHGRHEAVLTLLRHITPLFLECVSSLIQCEKFMSVITTLIQTDRTYLKMAKSLIASEFPGPITSQLGNMIQSHLEYFKRYNLSGPAPFVSLWIQVLTNIPDWPRDSAAIYLLDIVLCTAFFDQESKSIAFAHLKHLFQKTLYGQDDENGQGTRQGSALSSIMSWVSTGAAVGSPLLPASSCPEGPWFAFFALEIEQEELEEKTGLWREVLKELANMTGKPSIDTALKKASNTLKRPTPPSAMLSVYRWSQQALDTSVDHPLLPLMWQKFFLQFLCRVPSTISQPLGSVGPKFFEGMINLVYLKRIKKKLQECKEYYWAAVDECKVDEPEKRTQLENTARMLWTMGVWLEEPRLHEATLYLPALPPLYDAEKLAQVVQGDKKLWLELLDYEGIRETQKKSAEQWEKVHFRTGIPNSPSAASKLLAVSSHNREEGKNPIERILSRLQSYDAPEKPPLLKPFKASIPSVKQEALQSQNATIDSLKESLRVVLEYAQLYALRMSEHTALDCSFLEMVPSLYRDVETEVTLQATCQSEGYQNNHHNTVTCAGPATIRIKVREARVSERTEHMISQNRTDCEAIITRAMQPPPLKVCASSVQIEQTIKMLANEFISLQSQGSHEAQAAQRVHTVGVELFYYLVARYNEDLALYPPTKQLFTSCLEILGQVFVSGKEFECERLLSCMVQHHRLAGLLGPHFTPTVASSTNFLVMYRSVVNIATQPNTDLSFVLLSKFDVGQWLSEKKPKPSECLEFVDNVGSALTTLGPTPPDEKLILHELFCNHLRLLLKHQFPEHYCTVLNLLLKSSESQSLCVDVWYTVINVLLSVSFPQPPGSSPTLKLRPGMNPSRVMDDLRQYASNQKLLQYQELRETAAMLASHFNRERLQYGLYGLYPKYRTYVEVLSIFLGMTGHALVVSALHNGRGMIANKLVEELWPGLSAMFFPWIAPYWTDQLTEPTATWIQQLTDDRSVLPPWIVGDAQFAQRVMGTFVEVMRFLLDTLPASSNLLGFLWQFYVSHFAHTAIKEHTLTVVHTNLLTLPWMRFWPAPSHLDLMLKVVDQYLPDCHAFLGSIFVEVAWNNWLAQVSCTENPTIVIRVHTCLLHLLIKLGNEPSVKQSGKILAILVEARKFAWHLLDAQAYEPVVNWYVMSVDPRAILRLEDQEAGAIDSAVMHLLQVAADYMPTTTHFHLTTLRKRQMFVRAGVKVLVNCASRYKLLLSSNKVEFNEVVSRMLDDIEFVLAKTVPEAQQVPEAALLLMELLGAVNQPSGSALGALALESCVSWLCSFKHVKDDGQPVGSSVVVPALLKVVGTTVNDSTAMGALLEAALEAYFISTGVDWLKIASTLQPTTPRQPAVEDVLISNGHLLSLHGLLLLQLNACHDIREEAILLSSLILWLSAVKPTEQIEPKLPLLWSLVLRLALRQVSHSGDRATACASLRQLVQHANAVAEHKAGGWGLLGAIGIGKQLSVSARCRLLCRFLCSFVSAQMPESKADNNLVRSSSNSAGSITLLPHSRNESSLDVHPTADALKHLAALEGLLPNKTYAGIRSCIEISVLSVRNPENSLHNAEEILVNLVKQLYTERYLHASFQFDQICSSDGN